MTWKKSAPFVNALQIFPNADVGRPVGPACDGHFQVDADSKGERALREGQQLRVQLHAAGSCVKAGIMLLGSEMAAVQSTPILHCRLILCTACFPCQLTLRATDHAPFTMQLWCAGGMLSFTKHSVLSTLMVRR